MSILSAVTSAGAQLFGWIVREPCERNPESVAKAWEGMSTHAPTLADCGRMYAAYGRCFSIEQLRFITRHPDPLSLARWVASGWIHLRFESNKGFIAEEGFVSPRPRQISGSLWLFTVLVALFMALAIASVFQGQNGPALSLALLCTFLCALTLVEFVDVRSRHNARRAIEACSRDTGTPKSSNKPVKAQKSWRLFRVKRGLV